MLKRLFLLIFIFGSVYSFSQEKITLIYTGNMGIYLSSEESSVLIDGLHTKYGDDYLFPTPSLVNNIKTKLRSDVLLFTHDHGDHFSAALANEYLSINKQAILLGPKQLTKEINIHKDRLHIITTDDYHKQLIQFRDLNIIGININHTGKRAIPVENVGYIITMNSKKILHVGDTNWMEEINLFDQLNIINEQIDIAILPYWMLLHTNATEFIKKHITPKKVIATHISPRIKNENLQDLKNQHPNIHFLTTLEEQIQL